MERVVVRPATEGDAAAIARIYNHYVRASTATFETQERGVEHRLEWLREHGDRYPVLVADDGEDILGWASLSRYAARPGWRFTVEVSVYLSVERTGSGLGPQLLGEILDAGRSKGFHAVVAQIVGENEASLKMVERAGFRRVGTLVEAGNKFDRWLDVVLVERVLD